MPYTPDASDPSEPIGSQPAQSAALEFRTLKAVVPVRVLQEDSLIIQNTSGTQAFIFYTIPANRLAPGRSLRTRAFGRIFNNTGGDVDYTITYRLAGSGIWGTFYRATTSPQERRWALDIQLANDNSGLAQRMQANVQISDPGPLGTFLNLSHNIIGQADPIANLGVDEISEVTVSMSVASAQARFIRIHSSVNYE
jgi:hypothetical protein